LTGLLVFPPAGDPVASGFCVGEYDRGAKHDGLARILQQEECSMNSLVRLLTIGAAVLVFAGSAFADRKPTPDERSRIESKLKELGFASWDEIELDDDSSAWEVDDARTGDGQEYDIELHPETLDVLRQERD
jgi:hypothetical protein